MRENAAKLRWAGSLTGREKGTGWRRNTQALLVLLPYPVGVRITGSGNAKVKFSSSAEGGQIGRKSGEAPKRSRVLKAEHSKAPLGRGQTGWVPLGQALGPKVGPRRRPKAIEGAKRAEEGRPEKKMTEVPCRVRNHNLQQATRRRRQRLFFSVSEWRCGPEGGSATEASEGGVGAGGGNSGGAPRKSE